GRALSGAALQPELPDAAGAARRHREPHRRRPARLHPGGPALQHRAAHHSRALVGGAALSRREAHAAVHRGGAGHGGAEGRIRRIALVIAAAIARMSGARITGLAAALVCLILVAANGAPAEADPVFPPLTGRVVDQADLLSPAAERRIADQLEAHDRATGNQVVVVTLDSLQGYDIADYGYRLGRQWGIGRAGADDGLLLIVAPNGRQVRVEAGYGVEGRVTGATSHPVIANR